MSEDEPTIIGTALGIIVVLVVWYFFGTEAAVVTAEVLLDD